MSQRQIYAPDRLVDDVIELLRERGLSPHLPAGSLGQAQAGAGKLLRALSIEPLLDPVDGLARSLDKVWSEEDGLMP